jgi:membrane associated rhomboid family serine protease
VVLPVYDINPAKRLPLMTFGLIAANVIAFLSTPAARLLGVETVSLSDLCQTDAFFHHYGAIPSELITNQQLSSVPTGAVAAGECVLGAPDYVKVPALSVLQSMFLHAGWLHLIGNMLFLWVFGNNVEDRMGRIRFLLFYLITGYIAAYGFALSTSEETLPLVGASGAVSGILGAYFLLFPGAQVWSLVPILLFLPVRLPAWLVLGSWFFLQGIFAAGYAISGTDGVAYFAHVLGFLTGLLVALPMLAARSRRRKRQHNPSPITYSHRYW